MGFASNKTEAIHRTEYTHTPVIYENFTGEKNFGELGSVHDYYMDYRILALRSWQAYVESDIAKNIISEFCNWELGEGLRLEVQPKINILKSEGVAIDEKALDDFSQLLEDKFNLHANSRYSVYNKTMNLHDFAKEVKKHAYLSGDCLVIIRQAKNGGTNVELIDGMRVVHPIQGGSDALNAKKVGNEIKNGIELNKRGEHVAYYVQMKEGDLALKRVPAKGTKTGRLQAFLVYADRYRIDYVRGLPILSCVLETIKKLDRYKEASVGSAEERAKIVYQIVHQDFSTGENVLLDKVRNAISLNNNGKDQDQTRNYNIQDETAAFIGTTSQKETYNMPLGAELKALESKSELYFKDFMDIMQNLVYSAVGVAPEVIKKSYDSNYSASRMAIKSWEHTLNVRRKNFSDQFYKPIYDQFMNNEIISGKIKAPGYLEAMFFDKNYMILEAYRNARFIGANVPSVDPVKEAKAERLKLGESGADIPLTTPERATENLGEGDFKENAKKFTKQAAEFLVKKEEPKREIK